MNKVKKTFCQIILIIFLNKFSSKFNFLKFYIFYQCLNGYSNLLKSYIDSVFVSTFLGINEDRSRYILVNEHH